MPRQAKKRPRKSDVVSASYPDAATLPELPDSDPTKKPFEPENLDRTVIAIPLLKILEKERLELAADSSLRPKSHKVIIDLNMAFPKGREKAREWVLDAVPRVVKSDGLDKSQRVHEDKSRFSPQYLFASLEANVIRALVNLDARKNGSQRGKAGNSTRAIYHIWPDFPIRILTNKSVSTVKADAARASFSAYGQGIVWAVMDSGVELSHPHFKLHGNLDLESPLEHLDFTGDEVTKKDPNGHGTHVAGIIAGEINKPATKSGKKSPHRAFVRNRDANGKITFREMPINNISGMAPKCKILSLRVLDADGNGDVSNLIAAIGRIQELNGHGRPPLLIHGVNISVGNDFEPEWFACGQSPLCVEVNRLVKSGVVVVVAAGNSGYGSLTSQFTGVFSAGMALTINDPGNADGAITVGSTHKEMPHVYGVSYFSSKGPTGDGRAKPDLVAPGEKIISCAAGATRADIKEEAGDCDYVEDSGTSMAAPHVSGVIAAFLSIRKEFIGQPEKVKEIFLATATDLKRERYFQGHGLVDLMRAIQSV
ncbi:MAG: serine protease AprX [Blastocatellia bacterium]|jgi:subtilisin family serine protease|nr:serine protease AprX [Blastocatellia bacterium]